MIGTMMETPLAVTAAAHLAAGLGVLILWISMRPFLWPRT